MSSPTTKQSVGLPSPEDTQENSSIPLNNDSPLSMSTESSPLSSLPSELLSTPEGFSNVSATQESHYVGATRSGSPLRRSQRKRKEPHRSVDSRPTATPPDVKKKRRLQDVASFRSGSSTIVTSPDTRTTVFSSPNVLLRDSQSSSQDPLSSSSSGEIINNLSTQGFLAHDLDEVEGDVINTFSQKINRLAKESLNLESLTHEDWKNDTMYPDFDRHDPTFYHADCFTKTASSNAAEHNSTQDSEAPSPTRKGGKTSNGKRTQKGKQKGRGSGGGAGGGSGGRDSPEPPNRTALPSEDKATLAHIRARQAELKKFFSTLATQQREALELLASRDLSRLLRKSRAHQKVPEYETVLQELAEQEERTRALVVAEYEKKMALVAHNLTAESEILDMQFNIRVAEAQKEHVRGAKGDLTIFANAHRAANDGTWTEHGSDVGDHLPRYHELPEPDTHVRGYSSLRITDEKSFKEQLMKYDEEARRDVIEDDILEPVRQSVVQQNVLRQVEEEEKCRKKLDELSVVAEEELKKFSGYLIPRPLQASENPQFALSRLADCADYIAKMHPEKSYVFMPVAPNDMPSFPRNFLERVPAPLSTETNSVTAPSEPPSATTPRRVLAKKQTSISIPSRRPTKDEESLSQSSSNTSTPLPPPLQSIAPAPSRMPPPPAIIQQHHHHSSQSYLHPFAQGNLPPTTTTTLPRPPSLTPLVIPKAQATLPEISSHGLQRLLPSQVPPPPSAGVFRPSTGPQQFGPPLPQSPHQHFPGHYSRPSYSLPPYQEQPLRMPLPARAPPPSPIESTPSMQSQQNRFAVPGYGRSRTPRPGGSRRNSGQITFTQTYTPSSARFKPNPSPLTSTAPASNSVSQSSAMMPQQSQEQRRMSEESNQNAPPPPSSQGSAPVAQMQPQLQPQLQVGNGEPTARVMPLVTTPVGRMVKDFANPQIDSKTLADTARQNAARAQGQGAGPKGGKRVLLPKAG